MKTVLIVISIFLFGCSDEENSVMKKWKEVEIRSIERCEQAGGYPLRSVWDSRMVECQYPRKQP